MGFATVSFTIVLKLEMKFYKLFIAQIENKEINLVFILKIEIYVICLSVIILLMCFFSIFLPIFFYLTV